MKKLGIKQISEIRKKHNVDILKRMKSGEALKAFDSQASWFPPRPVIEKDPKAIAKLYQSTLDSGMVLVDLKLSGIERENDANDQVPLSS